MRRVKVNDSISADVAQPSKVSGNLTGMTSAVFGYIGGDPEDQTNLVELIDSKVATGSSSGIAQEKAERILADDTEKGLRTIADSELQLAIDAETSARIASYNNKVDKINGKQLSTNDFTDEQRNKLNLIEWYAENNKVNDVKVNNETVIVDKIANIDLTSYDKISDRESAITSARSYTDTEVAKKQNVIDNSHKLNSNLVDDTNSGNKFVTDSQKTEWSGKQDAISDLTTIRSNATDGAAAKATVDTYGDVVTHNASEFATAAQGLLANSATQPGDNISTLTNDAGYTANAGTVTSIGISMNGSSKGVVTTSGTIDLGTVITAHQDISGKQDVIDASHNLSADLVANGSTNKVVTQTEKNTWSGKQNAITSTNKLSSDLVDDNGHDNKFVTASDKVTWNNKQNEINASNKLSADYISNGTTNKVVTQAEKDTWNSKQNALPAVTNDRYLHTNASTGALEWSSVAAGGVTSISAGSGISTGGSPITTTGTISVDYNSVQSKLVFNTAYDATSNKAATMADINAAIVNAIEGSY